MTIEFHDWPGSASSSVTFRDEVDGSTFIGLIQWSPSRDFGLAVGRELGQQAQRAIFFARQDPTWNVDVVNPHAIHLSDHSIGVFIDGRDLIGFHAGGVMFRTTLDYPWQIETFEVTERGFTIIAGRSLRRFDFHGVVLGTETSPAYTAAGLLSIDSPGLLRWDRMRLADQRFKLAETDDQAYTEAGALYGRAVGEFGDMPRQRAICLRRLGELALFKGNTAAAIEHWRRALVVDRRCGIERRLRALLPAGS